MSNPFLNPPSGGSSINTSSGTLNADIASLTVSDLLPSYPVKTDSNKKLVSSLIAPSDCSFAAITNPFTGTFTATVDVVGGGVSLISRAPKASPTFSGTITTPLTAGFVKTNVGGELITITTIPDTSLTGVLPLSGGTMTGSLYITNMSPSSDESATIGSVGSTFLSSRIRSMVTETIYGIGSSITLNTANILPTGTATILGSATAYFDKIYANGLIPSANDTYDLGATGPNKFWRTVYSNGVSGGSYVTLTCSNSIRPYADNVISCGDSTRRWTAVYASALTSTSDIALTALDKIYPTTPNLTLGGPSHYWNNMYTNAVNLGGSDLTTLLISKAPVDSPLFTNSVRVGNCRMIGNQFDTVSGNLLLVSYLGMSLITGFNQGISLDSGSGVTSVNGSGGLTVAGSSGLSVTNAGLATARMRFDTTANTIASTSGGITVAPLSGQNLALTCAGAGTATITTANQVITLNPGTSKVSILGGLTCAYSKALITLNGAGQTVSLTANVARTVPLTVTSNIATNFTVNTSTGLLTYTGSETLWFRVSFVWSATFTTNASNITSVDYSGSSSMPFSNTPYDLLATGSSIGGTYSALVQLATNGTVQLYKRANTTNHVYTYLGYQMFVQSIFA